MSVATLGFRSGTISTSLLVAAVAATAAGCGTAAPVLPAGVAVGFEDEGLPVAFRAACFCALIVRAISPRDWVSCPGAKEVDKIRPKNASELCRIIPRA